MAEADPVIEERIQYWMRQIQQGKGMPMPVSVRRADGTVYPLGDEDRCKMEAAMRLGEKSVNTYVIKEENTTPEKLADLRKKLEQSRAADN
jgi:hypothetical protein